MVHRYLARHAEAMFMNARVKLSIEDAADIVYATLPKGWRLPPTNEIDAQRALEAVEGRRREDSELDTEI